MKQPLYPVKSLSLEGSSKGNSESKCQVGGVPAHGMGTGMRWSSRPLPTQTILGFQEKEAKVLRRDKG